MDKEKYVYKDLNELNITSKLIGEVYYKPRFVPILITLVGPLFLLLKNVLGIAACILFSGFGLLLIFWVKDHVVLTVYEDCVLVYDDSHTQAVLIENKDIQEWNVNLKEANRINLILGENMVVARSSFKADTALKYLNQTMKDKNTLNLPQEEEETFFSWLIEKIKGIVNSIKNK